jgi:hypothetical protein
MLIELNVQRADTIFKKEYFLRKQLLSMGNVINTPEKLVQVIINSQLTQDGAPISFCAKFNTCTIN